MIVDGLKLWVRYGCIFGHLFDRAGLSFGKEGLPLC